MEKNLCENESKQFDRYGFPIGEYPSEPMENLEKESILEKKWISMLNTWDLWMTHNSQKIRKKVMKGIPHSLRKIVWQTLADIEILRCKYPSNYFDQLLQKDIVSKYALQIELDVDRTFFSNKLFRFGDGKENLTKILKAYAAHNPSLGYCQGMSYVAGVILLQTNCSEDAFWLFLWAIDKQLSQFYNRKMSGLLEEGEKFDNLLSAEMPELKEHLTHYGIDSLLVITPWIMSLFSNLPIWTSVLRIFDVFFCDGADGVSLMCYSLIKSCQDDLIKCKGVERILPYIQKLKPSIVHPERLFSIASSVDLAQFRDQMEKPDIANKNKRKSSSSDIVEQKTTLLDRFFNTLSPMLAPPKKQRRNNMETTKCTFSTDDKENAPDNIEKSIDVVSSNSPISPRRKSPKKYSRQTRPVGKSPLSPITPNRIYEMKEFHSPIKSPVLSPILSLKERV